MQNFAITSIFASKEQVASKYGSYEGVLVKFFSNLFESLYCSQNAFSLHGFSNLHTLR